MRVTSYTNMTEAIQELRKRGFTANSSFSIRRSETSAAEEPLRLTN